MNDDVGGYGGRQAIDRPRLFLATQPGGMG